MGTVVLGWILIGVGLVSLLAGIGGGIAKLGQQLKKEREEGYGGLGALATVPIKALIEFIQALGAAPLWLAITILGIFLIAWGGTMI